jgi:hypothetical protein
LSPSRTHDLVGLALVKNPLLVNALVHAPIGETQEQDEAAAAELRRSRGLTSLK